MIHYYIQNSFLYRYVKALKDYLFKLLLISSYSLTNVTYNFIISLPINKSYNAILIIIGGLIKKNIIYQIPWIRTASLLKWLLYYYYRMFRYFMAYNYHLFQIETSGLFQGFRRISTRFLVSRLIYIYLLT